MRFVLGLLLSAGVAFASVDINHATVNELTQLKGIGDAKAARIVNYVKRVGCFKSVDELAKIKGIGEGFIAKNKQNIKIVPCKTN